MTTLDKKLSASKMSALKMTAVTLILTLTSCSSLTGKRRVVTFGISGASIGAVGGYKLSPNKENQGLNTLVFGLTGALVGSVVGALTDKNDEYNQNLKPGTFKTEGEEINSKTMTITPYENLPSYVKKRLEPIVIEEYIEGDQVDEDGVLRTSHKAYRIKRLPEFSASPIVSEVKNLQSKTKVKTKKSEAIK